MLEWALNCLMQMKLAECFVLGVLQSLPPDRECKHMGFNPSGTARRFAYEKLS